MSKCHMEIKQHLISVWPIAYIYIYSLFLNNARHVDSLVKSSLFQFDWNLLEWKIKLAFLKLLYSLLLSAKLDVYLKDNWIIPLLNTPLKYYEYFRWSTEGCQISLLKLSCQFALVKNLLIKPYQVSCKHNLIEHCCGWAHMKAGNDAFYITQVPNW